jgi:phosphoglycolate phosphatase
VPVPDPSPLCAVRAIAIDLDGTLLDTIHDLAAAANRMLVTLGYEPLPTERVRTMVGKGMANLVRRALAEASGSEPDDRLATEALAIYERCYLDALGEATEVFPGVVEGLDAFRAKGYRLACVTNKAHRFAARHLDLVRLTDRFELVVGGDSLARKKPDPLPLVHIAGKFGISPRELLLIGDSGNDTQAARAAGCPVVVVTYGYSEGRPVRELDADGIVDSLVDVARLLDPSRR